MTTDDPCDELPDAVTSDIWARLMIDQTRMPARSISLYTQAIGKAVRFITGDSDPHDNWVFPRHTVVVDDPYGHEPRGTIGFFDRANLPDEAAQLAGECRHQWVDGAEGAFAGLTEHCSHCGLER